MKKSELIAAAKDLNAVLGLEPAIDLKQDVAKIKQLVTQAAELVEPTDTLAPVTELVFAELGVGPAAAEEAPKGKAKAAPKGKAKAKPAPEPDEDEVEEDDYDDDEITVIDDPTPAPAPKAKGKGKAAAPKAKAEPKAKAAPKAPAKTTRLVAAVEAIQALSPDDSSSIDELVAEADAIYGTANVAEARQMTRQALTVLEAWGAIAITDGVVTVL